jgi:hypothetical protein
MGISVLFLPVLAYSAKQLPKIISYPLVGRDLFRSYLNFGSSHHCRGLRIQRLDSGICLLRDRTPQLSNRNVQMPSLHEAFQHPSRLVDWVQHAALCVTSIRIIYE